MEYVIQEDIDRRLMGKFQRFGPYLTVKTQGRFAIIGIPYRSDNTLVLAGIHDKSGYYKLFSIYVGTKGSNYYKCICEMLKNACEKFNGKLVEV